jgi:hypothetical protein
MRLSLIDPTALFAGLALALTAVAASPQTQPSRPAAPAAGPYASARTCSSCHQAIHDYWLESAHAQSASKPSFRAALEASAAGAPDKEAVRRGCVWCHAPTTLATADYGLQQPITKEGVTCDFCHTVADVDLDKADHPFELDPGKVKRGPLLYAKSASHQSEYSPLHKSSSLLCASCHEHRNAHGVAVLSTYTEWKESPYPARGMVCQECHMPTVPGRSVREGLQSTQRVINLHRMVGGSGYAQIRRGLELRIESVALTGASAEVRVTVTNAATGHAVPGGLSSKALVLAVGVETARGQLTHRQERVYRRDLLDAQGRSIATVPELFLQAASVGEDTRIKPKESRGERFTLPIVEGSKAIVARLEYRDSSDPEAGPKTTLVTEARRDVTAR